MSALPKGPGEPCCSMFASKEENAVKLKRFQDKYSDLLRNPKWEAQQIACMLRIGAGDMHPASVVALAELVRHLTDSLIQLSKENPSFAPVTTLSIDHSVKELAKVMDKNPAAFSSVLAKMITCPIALYRSPKQREAQIAWVMKVGRLGQEFPRYTTGTIEGKVACRLLDILFRYRKNPDGDQGSIPRAAIRLPEHSPKNRAAWWKVVEMILIDRYGEQFETHEQFSHWGKNKRKDLSGKAGAPRKAIRDTIKREVRRALSALEKAAKATQVLPHRD